MKTINNTQTAHLIILGGTETDPILAPLLLGYILSFFAL